MGALLREALKDQLADWRQECEALSAAFDAWSKATPATRGRAYAEYRAALTREEESSDVLRELLAAVRAVAAPPTFAPSGAGSRRAVGIVS